MVGLILPSCGRFRTALNGHALLTSGGGYAKQCVITVQPVAVRNRVIGVGLGLRGPHICPKMPKQKDVYKDTGSLISPSRAEIDI